MLLKAVLKKCRIGQFRARDKMTPAQIAEAEKLVKEWKPGPCEPKSAEVSN